MTLKKANTKNKNINSFVITIQLKNENNGSIKNCSNGLNINVSIPTNKWLEIKITKQRLQNANTKQQPQNQNVVEQRNDYKIIVINRQQERLFQ